MCCIKFAVIVGKEEGIHDSAIFIIYIKGHIDIMKNTFNNRVVDTWNGNIANGNTVLATLLLKRTCRWFENLGEHKICGPA